MATLLDWVLEAHSGPEPRVVTADVRAVLRRIIRPESDEEGSAVSVIAERAGVSPRTVYRVLNPGEYKEDMGLDLADKLCLACGSHIKYCRLVWPDGSITAYDVLRCAV